MGTPAPLAAPVLLGRERPETGGNEGTKPDGWDWQGVERRATHKNLAYWGVSNGLRSSGMLKTATADAWREAAETAECYAFPAPALGLQPTTGPRPGALARASPDVQQRKLGWRALLEKLPPAQDSSITRGNGVVSRV